MSMRGRLTRDRLGFTFPPSSPMYGQPPIIQKNVETAGLTFETELESALDLLPDVLQLEEPAAATFGIYSIGESSLGAYLEAFLGLHVLWHGEPRRYSINVLVTNDASLTYGREVLGIPKKLGVVHFERNANQVFGYGERPANHRLFNFDLTLREKADTSNGDGNLPATIGLRLIGQPEGCHPQIAAELLETPVNHTVWELWTGNGRLTFPEGELEWQVLPVKKVISAFYGRMDVDLPQPKLLAKI